MNNFKNVFGIHVSRNVCSKSIHQGEGFFKKIYLRSRLVKNVKSDPFLKTVKPDVNKIEGNLIKASNKTKTIYGGSRKSLSLERNSSLDGHMSNGCGTFFQVAGFKNGKDVQKSSKINNSKITKENLINQEARSYAKVIANYSRAMENDSVYTRSFEQRFGRSSISISDSPFNSVVPPLSRFKKTKEVKTASILNTRNSSSSPKYRRVRDIHSADINKNVSRNSFYSTDSGIYNETVKTPDIIAPDAKNIREKTDETENDLKMNLKDVLDSVNERAIWLDKVIKAHQDLKKKSINQDKLVSFRTKQEKITSSQKKDQIPESSKPGSGNSKSTPLIEVDAQCPIEASFMPNIDPLVLSHEIKLSFEKDIPTKETNVSVKENRPKLSKSESKIDAKRANFQKESTRGEQNDSNYINLRIRGQAPSEFVAKNGEIEVVSSSEKLEIRIPISTLFAVKANEKDHFENLKKSKSTLSLQITAKIENQSEKRLEGHTDKVLNVAEKSEPKKEVTITNFEVLKTPVDGSEIAKIKSTWNKKLSSIKVEAEKDSKLSKEATKEVSTESKISKNLSTTKGLLAPESSKLEKKEKIDDNNLTKAISSKSVENVDLERGKIRKRKKGTTAISRIIENELEKQNEQVLKEKKLATALTTETKKNPPAAEAVKPETKRLDQESSTIDKVTKKMDALIDQSVTKKLIDTVIPSEKKVTDYKKSLGLLPSGALKTKLKNQTPAELSSNKGIDATSDTAEKHTETKEQADPSKIHLAAKSQTKDQTKQRMTNNDLQSATKVPLKLSTESSKTETKLENKIEMKAEPKIENKLENKAEIKAEPKNATPVAKIEILKTKRDVIGKKDIPQELKPLEKKKDGTLIDYGLKVPTRKIPVKSHLLSKEQPLIKGILSVSEKTTDKSNSTKLPLIAKVNSAQLKSSRVSFPCTQKKAEKPPISSSSKSNDILLATSDFLTSKNEDFQWINQKSKLIDFKTTLKLTEFEENHIFSGQNPQSLDLQKTGVLRSSTAKAEKKDSTVKPDNKGAHGKTTGSLLISDTSKDAVQIDDCSENQSTSKINSLKKNCLKLFSKTSQTSGSKSASHIERLMKISLNKSQSKSSNVVSPMRSSSAMKNRSPRPEKELLYANWLQTKNNNVITNPTDFD